MSGKRFDWLCKLYFSLYFKKGKWLRGAYAQKEYLCHSSQNFQRVDIRSKNMGAIGTSDIK